MSRGGYHPAMQSNAWTLKARTRRTPSPNTASYCEQKTGGSYGLGRPWPAPMFILNCEISRPPRSGLVSNVTGFNIFSVSGFKRCDRCHRQRGQIRIIYLIVEMRNRSKDGGRYAQDHYRDCDRCNCDSHYGMGSVATGKHNQSAGRRRCRADARASPVVKSRASSTLTDNGCGPGTSPPW